MKTRFSVWEAEQRSCEMAGSLEAYDTLLSEPTFSVYTTEGSKGSKGRLGVRQESCVWC